MYLKRFEEVQTRVGEDDPEFLPPVGVFEFPEKIAAKKGLERGVELLPAEGGIAMPADVDWGVGALVPASWKTDILKKREISKQCCKATFG